MFQPDSKFSCVFQFIFVKISPKWEKRKIKTNEIKRSKLFAKVNDGEIDNLWLPFFPFIFSSFWYISQFLNTFVSFAANSLICSKCNSSKSYEECAANATTVDCPMDDARCVHFNYEVTQENSGQKTTWFGLGCVANGECSSSFFPPCKSLAEGAREEDKMKITCHVSCCGNDFCNSQVSFNFSVLVLLMSLFLQLFLKSFSQ